MCHAGRKNIGNEKSSENESEGEAERQGGREIQSGSRKVSHLYSLLPSRQVSCDLHHQ